MMIYLCKKCCLFLDELSPLMKGMQDLKYSPEENTSEELAKNYKEDGNFQFKVGS